MAARKYEYWTGVQHVDWDLMPFTVEINGVKCQRLSELRGAMIRAIYSKA